MKLLIINGPNLNFLGIREKGIYGEVSYEGLLEMIKDHAEKLTRESGVMVTADCFQSNHEGAVIDRIQAAYSDGTDGIVINPGAYTHYSYAIHDALKSIEGMPKAEVHISDIHAREDFRRVSVTAPACQTMICGHGLRGYAEAMDFLVKELKMV